MKFDIWHIIAGHFSSMHQRSSGVDIFVDVVLVYLLPMCSGVLMAVNLVKIDPDFYGVSISAFSVFSALLLNTQIAIFAMFGRRATVALNDRERRADNARDSIRDDLIRDLNTNVAYLMVLSVFALALCCIFFIFDVPYIEQLLVGAVYVHFTVTILIVVKRSYALFAYEYR